MPTSGGCWHERTSRRFGAIIVLTLVATSAGVASAAEGIFGYTDGAGVVHLSNVTVDGPYRLILRNPEDYRLKSRREYRIESGISHAQLPERPYAGEIGDSARRAGISSELLHAVIAVESNYNPSAVSPKGAKGLMQLMPDTARRFGVRDPFDPRENVRGGAAYLVELLSMFENDLTLALAAYNAGEGAVVRHGRKVPPFRETMEYVARVSALYRDYLGAPRRQEKAAIGNVRGPV